MVYFGVYQPRRIFVWLLSFYTAFVGIVIYMILAMSAPFQGATAVDSAPLQLMLQTMRESQDAGPETVREVTWERPSYNGKGCKC